MRLFIVLAAIVLLGVLQTNLQAQDANMAMSVEATANTPRPRTPALVIHEAAVTAHPAAIEAAKSSASAEPSKVSSTLKDAPTKALTQSASPTPILIPNAPMVQTFTAELGTTGNPAYDVMVRQSAAKYGVDPNLVFALMKQESGYNSRAVSYKGACGLMQLMPGTARRFGVTNIFDPAQNIDAGVRYLRFLLDMFNGDVQLALAGYNAGENAVVNSGYQIPRYRETQNYVKVISAKYSRNKHAAKASAPTAAPTKPVAPEALNAKGRLSNNY
ncbi:MAG: lytic transglycosylase domain-containing protein [Acidobacteria bacterium]|nr:lytic transglycosylase domain-containing protein [Acidobacteriota bacterium]